MAPTFAAFVASAISDVAGVTLVPHRWGVLAAIGSMLAMPAWAEDGAPADVANPEAFRQGLLLDTFGKWQIREGLANNTYLLIGGSTGDAEGHFWLHCDKKNLITVALPLAERPGSDRLRSQAITIRSDTGLKRAMSLIVFENFVAIAIDYEGARNDKVADFLDVLHAAKETVTISYADRNFDFDVAQLPAAQSRFQELCNQAVR